MSFAARYFGRCGECGEAVIPGMEVQYHERSVVHSSCVGEGESPSGGYIDGYIGRQRPKKADLICTKCHLAVPWVVDGVCQDCG